MTHTCRERENFYRNSTLIVDHTNEACTGLLHYDLTKQGHTLLQLIEANQHEIYHLCYNNKPCCMCPPGSRASVFRHINRILNPAQLDILLDTSAKIPGHNPNSQTKHCCCPANPNINYDQLDLTLTRCLLLNFTTVIPDRSPERLAVDELIKLRNESYGHATKGKISDHDYQIIKAQIEKSIMVLAKAQGRESEFNQKLIDAASRPLDETILRQYQTTLMANVEMIQTLIESAVRVKILPGYLTKDLEDIKVVEGCDARLEFWTAEGDVNVEWFKGNNRIEICDKYVVETSCQMHRLVVANAELTDRGIYAAKFLGYEKSARLDIEEYFTKNLYSIECIEGETAEFICEVIEYSLPASWSRNGVHLENDGKYEILQAGKLHRLSIKSCDLHDTAKYTVSINNRVRETSLVVIEYFTKSLDRNIYCIEGDKVDLCFEVLDADATAEWVKEGVVLQNCDQFEIKVLCKIHTLSIIQAELQDAGDYTVKINRRLRSTTLHIKEYFTKSLATRTCVEGENVHFECEVLEDDQTALWLKDGTEVSTSSRYQVEKYGKLHRLVVNNATLYDQGEYSIRIKKIVRSSKLVVQELPHAIRQLSDKEKELYLEIIRSGTETRFYIRIVIIGENGVGKTCLLRRMLGKSIEDVESTDGVDVHMCKIRQHDGQWVVDEVTNLKRDMMTRIKMAVKEKAKKQDALTINAETHEAVSVNAKTDKALPVSSKTRKVLPVNAATQEDANNEQNNYSQNRNSGSSEDKQSQPGTSIENGQTKVERKSRDNNRNKIEPSAPGTYDSRQRNSDGFTLPEDEFHRSLGEYNQLQKLEKKIEPRLEKMLTETILNELSQFINDIEKYEMPNEVLVDCGIWDFAGQKHYYPTHPIFLNPNAVHLLVADIAKDIKQINTEGGYDKIGEYIDFWFDSIHSCGAIEATKKSAGDYLNPPVIVVCTGMDKCKDQLHERKEKFRKQLLSMMHKEEKQKHLRRICHVSNTEPLDKDFDDLRKSIFEFGKNIESYGKKLPLRWIRLEQTLDIVRGAGMNLLSWPDMTDLASKCSIEDELEVSLFLKYHHKVGSIIYFESLKEHVILNPKWLADAFRCFVSDKFDDDLKLTPEWKTLEDTGELKQSLIVKLLHKEREREFYKHERLLVKVMEMFGVIVKLQSCMEENQSVWTYYMPCMISEKTSIEEICNVFGVKRDSCTQTPWLCIQFDFMPFDFFNHIFCYYIRKYTICTEALSGRTALYHGMGVFFLDNTKSRKFILCFSKNAIAMQIWQWRKLEQGTCKSMLEELRSVVHTVKDKYEPRRISYYEKIKCSNGNIHINLGRCSYKDLTDLGDFFCEEHNEMHDTRDFFETWFEEYSEENIQYPKNRNYESISKEDEEVGEETAVPATAATPSQPISTIQKFPYDVEVIYTRIQHENKMKHGSQDSRFKQKCHVCDKEPSVNWCHDCQKSMCQDCNNQHGESTDTEYHIVQHVQDVYSLDYNFKVNVRRISDIKVLHDDMLVIADYWVKQLVTCDITGQQQHTIPLPGEPWFIAVVDNNTVAVTLYPNTVVIVDVRQKQDIQRTDVKVECSGIMYRDNQLFVGCGVRTIKVMNMSGEVTRTIPVGVEPYYICAGEAGHIYYTDGYKLYCIDTVGNTLFKFTDPNTSGPWGITTDDEGHVLVTCFGSNNVLRISPDGKQSQVIITQIPSSGWPPYICYNSLSKSLVIGCFNDVYVYKKV